MSTSPGTTNSHTGGAGGAVDLRSLAQELLSQAKEADAGRVARTLTPGTGGGLKQVVLALAAGGRLSDHVAPGPATLFALEGEMALTDEEQRLVITAGTWAPIPRHKHGLEAVTDAVALLTVATPGP